MSCFPPPPPAPPPAQSFPTLNYPPNSNGFRGRGTGRNRGRGFSARSGINKQIPHSHCDTISKFNGNERNYGHNNGSFSQRNVEYHGIAHQSLEDKKVEMAHSTFRQPQLSPNMRKSITAIHEPGRSPSINRNSETWHRPGSRGILAWGPHPASGFQDSTSMSSHLNAVVGTPLFPGTSRNVGYNEHHHTMQSNVHLQSAQPIPQSGGYKQPYISNHPDTLPPSQRGAHNAFQNYGSHGQKRGHGEAFGRGGQTRGRPKGHAPPAVPSFGGPLPLPANPTLSQDEKNPNAKKKRKHNQLGLTPKTEEHESSEGDDEDIVDEETRLAAAASAGTNQSSVLQVSYRGHTSTLQSPSDIAAWIAERRRRFPTKVRIAEVADQKKQREEARRQVVVAQKQRRNERTAEVTGKRMHNAAGNQEREKATEGQKAKKGSESQEDGAAKRRHKVEKLRRQLEEEEKQLAKAELRNKRKRSPILANSEEHQVPKMTSKRGGNPVSIINASCPTMAAPESFSPTTQSPKRAEADQASISTSDSSSTDSEDFTSSSGSVSSDSDASPEEETSKKVDLENLPPKRGKPKQLCKFFVANGRCRLGSSCRFKHELPKRGLRFVKVKEEVSQPAGRKERISLYQRLIEQEKKTEEEAVLKAIIQLGDNGILDQAVENGSKS